MKTRTWRDPVFGSDFVLMWDGTPKQFGRRIKQKYDPKYVKGSDFLGRCFDTDTPSNHTVIIMLPKWNRRSNLSHAVLVHELSHATEYALRYRDVEHTAETSEVYAYFLDSLVQRCLKLLP